MLNYCCQYSDDEITYNGSAANTISEYVHANETLRAPHLSMNCPWNWAPWDHEGDCKNGDHHHSCLKSHSSNHHGSRYFGCKLPACYTTVIIFAPDLGPKIYIIKIMAIMLTKAHGTGLMPIILSPLQCLESKMTIWPLGVKKMVSVCVKIPPR